MNPVTQEWIQKADADFDSALREFRARNRPNFDAACFHAQQCAEKYLKARLQDAGIPFSKTHDLEALVNQLRTIEPTWIAMAPMLSRMTDYAVRFRYPGSFATRQEARDAIAHARQFRDVARSAFKKPPRKRKRTAAKRSVTTKPRGRRKKK